MSSKINEKFERALWPRGTVLEYFGWKSHTPLYGAIHKHGFPKPICTGGRRALWKREQILAWVDSRPQELAPAPVCAKRKMK